MKVGKEKRSGDVSHYILESTGSDLSEPTDRFRSFVDTHQPRTVSTAVTFGEFQHQLQQSLTAAASHPMQSAVAADSGSTSPHGARTT
jgi:hypothetical protein